jgi:hypothetical protein
MKRTSLTHYFVNGFALANQSLDILLIDIVLVIPSLIGMYVENAILGKAISLISYILVFIGFVFTLSIPVFLVYKQRKEVLTYKEIFDVVVKNIRRMIFPTIVCFLLLTVLMIILVAILLATKVISPPDFSASDEVQHVIPIAFIFVLSFFEFTSFYFSLEYNGFFTSMRKSLVAAFNNLRYIAPVILCGVASYVIFTFLSTGTLWGDLLRSVIGLYISFVVIASSLSYYQDVIKDQDMIKEDPFVKTPRGRTVNRRP